MFRKKTLLQTTDLPIPAIQFTWLKSAHGYVWRKAGEASTMLGHPPLAKSDLVLTSGLALGTDSSVESYALPQDLYLRFASAERTPEAVKAFADQFGLLGFRDGEGRAFLKAPGFVYAESLMAWQAQIHAMRSILDLWEMIENSRAGRSEALAKRIRWRGTDRVDFVGEPEFSYEQGTFTDEQLSKQPVLSTIAASSLGTPPLKQWDRDDIIGPALEYLRGQVNRHGRVSALLLWELAQNRLGKHMRTGAFGLYFAPESLISALWVQFAFALAQNRRLARCENESCKAWMSIKGSDRRTCSPRCRLQRHRKRVDQALRLYGEGNTPHQIALSLDADQAAVERWLSRSTE